MVGDGSRRIRRESVIVDHYIPDGVIENIVSRLNIQEAVRAGLVAKPWRDCWKLTRDLTFDLAFYDEFIQGTAYRLDAVANSILARHTGPIKRFEIHIPSRAPFDPVDISEGIRFLSEKEVEWFSIHNSRVAFHVLPSDLYNFSRLEYLSLDHCKLSASTNSFIGFPNLECIRINDVIDPFNMLTSIISQSPQLVQIDFDFYYDGSPVEIRGGANIDSIFYHCKMECRRPLCLIGCLPKVNYASLETPLQLPGRPSGTSLLAHFSNLLPGVKHLYLDAAALNSLYEEDVPPTLATFEHLKYLTFEHIDISSVALLSVAFRMMRSAPKLKSLEFNVVQRSYVHIAARNFLKGQLQQPPSFTTIHHVEFKYLKNTGIELKLILTIIKLSPNLKSIKHCFCEDNNSDKELKMYEKLRKIKLPVGAEFTFEWADGQQSYS